MRFRLAALAALALLATSASAQTAGLEGRGGYVALGGVSPERLLFPDSADPAFVAGLRLSEHVDLQIGVAQSETRETFLSRRDVSAGTRTERTGAVVLGAGYADRAGPALLRARLSLGYDDYSYQFTTYRPDSVRVFSGRPPSEETGPEYALALAPVETRTALGKFVHLAFSTSAGVPVRLGVVTVEPSVGVAGSISGKRSGSLEAPGLQALPFVRVPVSVRVGGVAVTAESTLGVAFNENDGYFEAGGFDRSTGRTDGVPVLDGALRVDF